VKFYRCHISVTAVVLSVGAIFERLTFYNIMYFTFKVWWDLPCCNFSSVYGWKNFENPVNIWTRDWICFFFNSQHRSLRHDDHQTNYYLLTVPGMALVLSVKTFSISGRSGWTVI